MMIHRREGAGAQIPTPSLSVLIPYFRQTPRALAQQLVDAATRHGASIELVVLDDGSGDQTVTRSMLEMVHSSAVPVTLLELLVNRGRSPARNLLAQHARGRFLLFLDADVLPVDGQFLPRYLACMQRGDARVVAGGIQLSTIPGGRDEAVARAYSRRTHCVAAAERAARPTRYVFTSNLLVGADVVAAHPFDEAFRGWGWEDIEWGIRVSRQHAIEHIDNPVIHLGLATTSALIAKHAESLDNFRRLLDRHPEAARQLPIYRASRLMCRLPGCRALERVLRAVVLHVGPHLPELVGYPSFKLYKACLYAPVLRSHRAGPSRSSRGPGVSNGVERS